MASADFYLIDKQRFREEPLLLVCELVRKAHAAELPTLVLARDYAQADALDELLWSFDADATIPHQLAGDEDDDTVPVLVVPPEVDTPLRPLVINLRDSAVADGFERVLEVIPADPAARDGSRQRWRAYQQRGVTLKKHDM